MGASCHSVSGNPAVVKSPAVTKIESMKVHFPPVQGGSGDPSLSNVCPFVPWNSINAYQSSTNIWDEVAEPGSLSGETGQNVNEDYGVRSANYIPVIPGSYIYVYYEVPAEQFRSNIRLFWYNQNKTFLSCAWSSITSVHVPENAYYLRFYGDSAFGGKNSNISINYPYTYKAHTPYTNKKTIPIEFSASGKNLFNRSTGIVLTSNNVRVARNNNRGFPFHMHKGVTYTVSCNSATTPSEIGIQVPYSGTYYKVAYGAESVTYTPDKDIDVAINIYWTNGRPNDADDIQIEVGSQKTSFEPYTSISTVRKNLVNPDLIISAYVSNKLVSYTPTKTAIVHVEAGKTYTISKAAGSRLRVGYTENFPYFNDTMTGYTEYDTTTATVTVPTGMNYMCVFFAHSSLGDDIDQMIASLQVEEGSVATSYEPYRKVLDVYGGYVDPVEGKIVVEWVNRTVKLSDATSKTVYEGVDFYDFYKFVNYPVVNKYATQKCDKLPYSWSMQSNTMPHFYSYVSPETNVKTRLMVYVPNGTDENTELTFALKLETPITYYFNPQELYALRDASSYWSDANDIVDVTYDVVDNAETIKAKKRIVTNSPHFEVVEPHSFGEILSFNANMKAPLKRGGALLIPSQSGSGDASTNNVRKVVGRKNVIVKRTRKNIAKLIGISAVGSGGTENLRSSSFALTNSYGTTINRVVGDSVTVTQSNYDKSPISTYQNGYISMYYRGLEFNSWYKISFRVTNITNNPLNASLSDLVLYNPRGYSATTPTIVDDRVTFLYQHQQNDSYPNRIGINIRICGMSATFSEFMVTAPDEEDQTYEPYEDHIGKNLFYCSANDKEQAGGKFVRNLDGTVTCSGTPTGYCTIELGQAFVNSSMGNVRVSGLASASNVGWDIIALYDETKTLVADFPEVGGSQSDKTIDLSSYPTAKYLVLAIKRQSNGIGMSGVVKPQVELGTTTTNFEPYCDDSFPIVISTPGKNLYPFKYETYTTTAYSNGYAWAGPPWKITDRTVKYTFSAYFDNTNGDRPCHVTIWMRNADNSDWADGTARTGNDIAAGSSGYSAVSIDFSNGNYSNTYYLCFGGALAGNAIIYRPMVELGSGRTDYEPYNENVYGAYIDWTEGVMAITHQCIEIPFEKEWSEQDIYFAKYQGNTGMPKFSSAIKDFFVSHHKNTVGIAGSVYINSSGHILFGKTFASELGISTSSELNTWLKTQHDNGTPLQVCGELSEPMYVPVDPVQIKTLHGYNVIRAGADEAVAIAYWTH